jgi:hypothetical protein
MRSIVAPTLGALLSLGFISQLSATTTKEMRSSQPTTPANASSLSVPKPPTGWIELKAVEPVELLWIHQITPKPVSESSLFSIQVHSTQDAKIRKLRTDLEAWQSTKRAPDLAPLQVVRESLESFELRESGLRESGLLDSMPQGSMPLRCLSFRATGKTNTGGEQPWRQTWCFTSQQSAIVAVERGQDRISTRERLQMLEHQAALLQTQAQGSK